MLILDEFSDYMTDWPHCVLDGHLDTLAQWFSNPQDPSGYGIGHLTNSVRSKDELLANSMIGASDSERVAVAVSKATASTAYNLAEMLALTGSTRPEPWKARFGKALDRKALISLGTDWPKSVPIFVYAELCQAVTWTDETLALDMVEAFLPRASEALASDSVSAFGELYDIASHVLRVLDVLGAYVGCHRPSKRGRRLARALCAAIKPEILARQISAVSKRDFQKAAMLLSFLAKASPAKFNQTVAAIDWEQISATIGRDCSNLFHDAEVFLAVCFHRTEHRAAITALIERNAHRIEVLAPRLALMAPEVAYRHVEQGRRIALSNFDHVSWESAAAVSPTF